MNLSKIGIFLKEVRLEMKKVNWPTRQETIRYTLIVIGISVGVAVFLGATDFLFNSFMYCFVLKGMGSCPLSGILGI